ncbi:MAG TPA: hypothetical protein VJ820_05165 [Propionibacteriaceae bacterium]|nr:hypothetical protein [Propionibacteriaceae bacterium]
MIKIAVDHGVVAAVGHTDAIYDQTNAAPRLELKPRDRSCPGAGRPESPPADLVVLDSTLTPTAVMIGGI